MNKDGQTFLITSASPASQTQKERYIEAIEKLERKKQQLEEIEKQVQELADQVDAE